MQQMQQEQVKLNYYQKQVKYVLDQNDNTQKPQIQVNGTSGKSHWLSVTPKVMRKLIDILADEE